MVYQPLEFTTPPQKIVSLVPSMTETIFDLGEGQKLIGITDYCIHPAEKLKTIPRLGGPKNPKIEQLIKLRPDLVLMNEEENSLATYEKLKQEGIAVYTSLPKSIKDVLIDLWNLAGILKSEKAMMVTQSLERSVDWIINSRETTKDIAYFCPVWQEVNESGELTWMTFNKDTYCSDLLNSLGGKNICDEVINDSVFPFKKNIRYPKINVEDVLEGKPEIIFLPDEPFCFSEKDREEISHILRNTPAVQNGRVVIVDGTLVTWNGTRMIKALQVLQGYFNN